MAVFSANNKLYLWLLFCHKVELFCWYSAQEQLGKLDAILSSVTDSLGNAKPDTHTKVFPCLEHLIAVWKDAELLQAQLISVRAVLMTYGYKIVTHTERAESSSVIWGTIMKEYFYFNLFAQQFFILKVIIVIKAVFWVVMQMPVGLTKITWSIAADMWWEHVEVKMDTGSEACLVFCQPS